MERYLRPMKLEFITAGKIVNAHGIRGDVKILPQGLDPALITSCPTLYIDGKPYAPTANREHKGCVLAKLPGIDDMDAALSMKEKKVTLRRSDMALPEDYSFDEELLGLKALDAETGRELGTLEEVMDYPAHKVYAIRGGDDEYLVPAVPAFVAGVDLDANIIKIHVWEGMGSHED